MGDVGTQFPKYTMEFQKAIEQLSLPDPEEIKKPKDKTDVFAAKEWDFKYKARDEQLLIYKGFRASIYSLLLGHSTPLMRDKLKAKTEFQGIQDSRDGIALLNLIKSTMFTYDSNRQYAAVSRDRLKEEFYGLKRQQNQSIQSYYDMFRAKVKLINEMGIILYDEDFLKEIATKNKRKTPDDTDKQEAQERSIAIHYIRTCGNRSYEVHLQTSFLDGQNFYPATLADARAVLDNRLSMTRNPNTSNNSNSSTGGNQNATGVAYNTTSTATNETNNNNEQQGSNTFAQTHVTPSQSHALSFSSNVKANIPPSWLLLDNQSAVDIISNQSLITNIRQAHSPITINSHAGSRVLKLIADLPNYGVVWFDPDGPVNLLSLNNAKAKFNIEFNSKQGDSFILSDRTSGNVISIFQPSDHCLYYMDMSKQHSFITTVKDNEIKFSQSETPPNQYWATFPEGFHSDSAIQPPPKLSVYRWGYQTCGTDLRAWHRGTQGQDYQTQVTYGPDSKHHSTHNWPQI